MLSSLSKSKSSINLAPYAYIIQSVNHLHLQLLSIKSGQITCSIGDKMMSPSPGCYIYQRWTPYKNVDVESRVT